MSVSSNFETRHGPTGGRARAAGRARARSAARAGYTARTRRKRPRAEGPMALFLVPERNAEAIVGARPPEFRGSPPDSVAQHLAAKRLLGPREHLRVALDESLFDDGSNGLALTNARLFRYSGKTIRTEAKLGAVERATVRRLW